jgi:hypothetical protein
MIAQRIGVMFLYLVISVYGMLALGLIVYAISSWRKRERGRRHLPRKNDESRTASDHPAAAFRNRGWWANTWLPRKVEIDGPTVGRSNGKALDKFTDAGSTLKRTVTVVSSSLLFAFT